MATGHHSNTTIAVFTYHTFGCCLIKYNLEEKKKNLNLETHNMRNNECYTGDKTNDKITSMFSPYHYSIVAEFYPNLNNNPVLISSDDERR